MARIDSVEGARAWAKTSMIAAIAILAASFGSAEASASQEQRGRELFERQCSLCHGPRGRANGPAAYLLFPPARDFGLGRFKLAGTQNGVPSEDDLVATLRRGMPGSAMPSWDWMPEEDLRALARFVREIAVEGVHEELKRADESETPDEDLLAEARARMTPGEPVHVSAAPAPSPELAEVGRQVFVAHCAACHGEDGKGRAREIWRDDDGTINHARDFTVGILRGGASHGELTKRLQVGLHGTVMRGIDLSQDQRQGLVTYVRQLIPPGAEDRLVQRRSRIVASRVAAALEEEMSELDWSTAEELPFALAPLWWKDDSIVGARVAAIHDGRSLAVRLRWEDPVADGPEHELPMWVDGAALQLSGEAHPPLFGMGHSETPTNIWHWRATTVIPRYELELALDLFPHRIGEWIHPGERARSPHYRAADGPLVVSGESVGLAPAGMKVVSDQELLVPSIDASASWVDGTWEVTFVRALPAAAPREIELEPGGSYSVNFAIWNGAVRDLRGQKSVTIWHELTLED